MDVDRPGHPVTADTPTSAPAVPRFVWIVGALGLAFAVAGLVLWVVPSRADEAQDSAADKAVISRVNDFATTYNTYDVADVDGYQERMSGLLTADYNADFVELTDALFEAIADKEQKSGDAVVKDVAVQSIDDDSAVALAVVDAQVTNTDNEAAILRQFRWTVNLQLVDGEWRVSQFESVAAQPADAEDAESTPAPTSTDGTPAPAPTAEPDAEDGQ